MEVFHKTLLAVVTVFAGLFSSAQNVGIGTNMPLQKLHVQGNAYITDNLGVNSSLPQARLDVNGTTLIRGGSGNILSTPVTAALELATGHNADGSLPIGAGAVDMAFQYAGPGGGFRHFISTRHDVIVGSPGNAMDFYINSSSLASGSTGPGSGNVRALSLSAASAGIDSARFLEFGVNVVNKENNAGKIGYESFTPGALDIVGAGVNGLVRKIKFWAEGGTTFNGKIKVQDSLQLYGNAVINGNLVINDGTQEAGRVLQSDATGKATWAVPAAGPHTIAAIGSVNGGVGILSDNPGLYSFIGVTSQVVVTAGQVVDITATCNLGTSIIGGARMEKLGIGFRKLPATTVNGQGDYMLGIQIPQFSRMPFTLHNIIEGLTPGTYEVGMVYTCEAGQSVKWNSNDWSKVAVKIINP